MPMSNDDLMNPELENEDEGETVEIEDEESEIEDTEDGGAIIRLKDAEDEQRNLEHFSNLVDEVSQGQLRTVVSDLLELIG